jgi:transcriptional regulator with XRE-family HTH domain
MASMTEQIGSRIKEIRKSLNLTQSDLAEGLVTRSFISQIEKGKVSPSVDTLEKISQRLNCSISDLIGQSVNVSLHKQNILSFFDTTEAYILSRDIAAAKRLFQSIPSINDLNDFESGRYYFIKALFYWEDKELNEAKYNLDKSISLLKDIHEEMIAKAYNLLGKILFHLGSINESLSAFIKALHYTDKYPNDSRLKIETLFNLGVLHGHLNEFCSAKFFLLEAEKMCKKVDSIFKLGEIYMALGVCYKNLGRWDEADQYNMNALSIFTENKNHSLLASVFKNLAYLKRKEKKWNESTDWLLRALSFYKTVNNHRELAICHIQIGKNFLLMDDRESAENYLGIVDVSLISGKVKGGYFVQQAIYNHKYSGMAMEEFITRCEEGLSLIKTDDTASYSEYCNEIGDYLSVSENFKEAALFYKASLEL